MALGYSAGPADVAGYLTPLQRRWVLARKAGLSPTQAARSAGYAGSLNCTRVIGHVNERSAKLRAAMDGPIDALEPWSGTVGFRRL